MEYIIYLLKYIAFFCWSCFSVFVIIGVIARLYKPKKSGVKARNIEFVCVSKASHKVRNSLFETIHNIKRQFKHHLWVVIDEGSELAEDLEGDTSFTLVVVPKAYRPDLVAKGRALNYFIENKVEDGKWYALVDDDNLILDDEFLYEIPYYEEKGYVAMNPIIIPRKGGSVTTYIMDTMRYFDDLTSFRFFTGLLTSPILGFHGELLTVKGSTLKEIGYKRRTITEDFNFGLEICRRRYKTWQSRTNVSIKSPNSLKDLLRQRGRWFRGITLDLKHAPPIMKNIVGLRLSIWILGIFGSWGLSFLWPLWGLFILAIPGGVYYWLVYLYGVKKAKNWKYIVIIPAFGIFEALSAYFGMKKQEFIVIDKD